MSDKNTSGANRRWTLSHRKNHAGQWTVQGPPLDPGESVEVAEVTTLRAEWEAHMLEVLRGDDAASVVTERLRRSLKGLSDDERDELARQILTDLTTPRTIIRTFTDDEEEGQS